MVLEINIKAWCIYNEKVTQIMRSLAVSESLDLLALHDRTFFSLTFGPFFLFGKPCDFAYGLTLLFGALLLRRLGFGRVGLVLVFADPIEFVLQGISSCRICLSSDNRVQAWFMMATQAERSVLSDLCAA